MNDREKELFDAITKDREENAKVTRKPSMNGIYGFLEDDNYSDQAHFVYELLQNADDAQATYARFILEPKRLIFIHNGKRHFSVSDPMKEGEDKKNGALGDINAITSIGNSNKNNEANNEAKIGKFGIGFKAVFQYTRTPEIYDPVFRFKIEEKIIPRLLSTDFPDRKPEETVFVFPFDKEETPSDKAFGEIKNKLEQLAYPTLFLPNLQKVDYRCGNVYGTYETRTLETRTFSETRAELLEILRESNVETQKESLWLFSRGEKSAEKYSVGFFLDDDGKLKAVDKPAFCFFQTKVDTNLNFVIHAPFLLNNSREGIKAGKKHNSDLIASLACLAADSLSYLKKIGLEKSVRLIDDKIVTIVPTDPGVFSDPNDSDNVSFAPFYEKIIAAFQQEELLPTADGYTSKDNACLASTKNLAQLFSNRMLAAIFGYRNAQWVFESIGRNSGVQRSYIENIVKRKYDEDDIIGKISSQFIESQSIEWLNRFYRWLSENERRMEKVRTKPFLLDQNKKAVAAFNANGEPTLFLPNKDITGMRFVDERLLVKDSDSRKYVEKLGIKKASLKDYILNVIVPKLRGGCDNVPEINRCFSAIYRYFSGECPVGESEEFLRSVAECKTFYYRTLQDEQIQTGAIETKVAINTYLYASSVLYWPSDELREYFSAKPTTRFLAVDKYRELLETDEEKIRDFFVKLGVKAEVAPITYSMDLEKGDYNYSLRPNWSKEYWTRYISWNEISIDGCEELIQETSDTQSKEKSIALWKVLLGFANRDDWNKSYWHWNESLPIFRGKCDYFYRSDYYTTFESSTVDLLKTKNWLVNEDGEFVSAATVTRSSLSRSYDTSSEAAQKLMEFLGIPEAPKVVTPEVSDTSDFKEEVDERFSYDERRQMILGAICDKYGVGTEELESILESRKRCVESRSNCASSSRSREYGGGFDSDLYDDEIDEVFTNRQNVGDEETRAKRETKLRVVKEVARMTSELNESKTLENETLNAENEENDADDFLPKTVDYEKKIAREKKNSARKLQTICREQELQAKASRFSRYSYGWFKTLLEMEICNSEEFNAGSREISVSFGKVKREEGTQRTLVLERPSRYLPIFMEELANIPLELRTRDQKTRNVEIEVANVKGYSLRVKLKNESEIDGLDLSEVVEASINAKNPDFLLKELSKAFNGLALEDDYDMRNGLCENVEFIFGPPGTGKTTRLAKDVLLSKMRDKNGLKILVLTPTNKSADVLTRRVLDSANEEDAPNDWLVRFGTTGDETLETNGVYRDKTFDIRRLERCVVVTTIARYPYDYFMPDGGSVRLNQIDWDYVVVDEASMIPLINVIYPLYKAKPKAFIIAGDPFQIQPITSVELWKDENIYKMVELNSFENPTTKPRQYKVEKLTTQYRSVPRVGEVFSRFVYDGVLRHSRKDDERRPLNLGEEFDVRALNLIRFPTSKYESVYRPKKLRGGSSYQTYSALFTFEFICELSRKLAENNPGERFTIGAITPYRAQGDLIDKLLASEKLPENVDVQAGTIHGFQGDERDIIFAVFNPPPTISSSRRIFLNNKNILNVSISRARDYTLRL